MASRLREADLREIEAHAGIGAETALGIGLQRSSQCYTGLWKDEPFIMFGAGRVFEDVGNVWLLGTDRVKEARVPLLRQSRRWLGELHKEYPLLFNYVDARNTLHIKWLRWLDFRFINLHPQFGVGGLPFYEFVRLV